VLARPSLSLVMRASVLCRPVVIDTIAREQPDTDVGDVMWCADLLFLSHRICPGMMR